MKYFLILIISTVTLISCGGAEERKDVYLEKAKQSLDAGDLDKARVELKNVLQIDPKDAQAYYRLGEIFEQKKDYQKAFANYSKAVEIAPDNYEFQAKLGSYLLLSNDIDGAIQKRDLILGKDALNVHGLLLKAGILYKQNDVARALKISQDVYSIQPAHVQNSIFLASLYLNDKKYDEAISVLKTSIKENPKNYYLSSAIADTYFKASKFDLAEKEYKAKLAKNPEAYMNHIKLAMFYRMINMIDQAENVLRNAIDVDDKDSSRKMVLVEFLQQSRGNQSAIDELNALITKNPKTGEFRLALAQIYIEEKNTNDAVRVLKAAVSDFSEDAVGIKSRIYLADLYMQRRNVDAAKSIVDEAYNISPNDSEVNFVKAKLEWKNKKYKEVIVSLRIVIKDKPDNIDAYFLSSAAHKAIGEKYQADEIIKKAYDNNRTNPEALLVIARYYAKDKNYAELEKVVDRFLSIDQSNNYEALTYKIALLNERKMFSESKLYVSKLLDLYPDLPSGYIQSLPSMLAENKRGDAIKLLEDGYNRAEDNSRILETLVSLHISDENFDMAENKVQTAIHEKGETADMYMLLAKTQWSSEKKDAAEASLVKAIAINPEWNEPYINLANLYKTDKSIQKAIEILQEGLIQIKGDYKLTLNLAKIYEELGDFNSAINVYDKAYEKYPESVILMNNIASLLSEHRNDEDSMQRAKILANQLKDANQPAILDTVGWIYYKTGDYPEAVLMLKKAVEKSPNIPIFNYHLGMALYKSGDKSAAKTYLNSALANNTTFPGRSEAEEHLNMLQ